MCNPNANIIDHAVCYPCYFPQSYFQFFCPLSTFAQLNDGPYDTACMSVDRNMSILVLRL